MIQHFDQNTQGSDYIVGDIHGCFEKLDLALQDLGFNESKDRLFVTGDLVDRGPQSEECLDWLAKSWFHSVLGNHEQMAIDCAQGFYDTYTYIHNGGSWFLAMTKPEQQLYADAFSALPTLIEVETPSGTVGIVHADPVLASWDDLKVALREPNSEMFRQQCIWNRTRFNNQDTSVVKDIAKIYVGHTPLKQDTLLGNVHYIDTGAVFGGKFTIVKIN